MKTFLLFFYCFSTQCILAQAGKADPAQQGQTVVLTGIMDSMQATKEGLYFNGYVVHLSHTTIQNFQGKHVEITGKVSIIKAVRNHNAGGLIEQGRSTDAMHIVKPKIKALPLPATDAPFDGHTWKAPYHLPEPAGWGIERFPVPVSFAPSIHYSGVEDIRFAPGWAQAASEEYWSYTFLWWLAGNLSFDKKSIQQNLQAYYDGLLKVNTDSARYAALDPVPAIVSVEPVSKQGEDHATFSGSIQLTDYMTLKPLTLHCIIHLRYCKDTDKTILFHELSPQPFSHPVWKSLHQIWTGFSCRKN